MVRESDSSANSVKEPSKISNRPTDDKTSADSNQSSGIEKPIASQISDGSIIKSESAQLYTEAKDRRDQQDLDAQQDMAFWAMLMFFATVATVIVAGLGVFFVKRTLDATLKAVQSTADATDEMISANEIARNALDNNKLDSARARKALRLQTKLDTHPYIGVVSGEVYTEQKVLRVAIKIKNYGSTPAVGFRGAITSAIRPDGHNIAIELPDKGVPCFELAPSQEYLFDEKVSGTWDELELVAKGEKDIFVMLSTKYASVFGGMHSFVEAFKAAGPVLQAYPHINESPWENYPKTEDEF